MKVISLLPMLLLLIATTSCKKEKTKTDPLIGRWQTSWSASNDTKYTQTITFFTNHTFNKEIIWAACGTKNATGIFTIKKIDHRNTIVLKYDDITTSLKQSCSGDGEEFLYIDEKNLLINNSWIPCDGPGYTYNKLPAN